MSKKFLAQALTCALVAGSSCMAFAATPAQHSHNNANLPVYNLNPVVVTATRTPVKAFNANADVNVITAKDIQENHFQNITEALQTVPGVIINNYAPAGYDNSNSIYINGSNNIVVLVDGVKVDNPQLQFSGLQTKDLSNIAKIEVLKGSASTLYGSNAKGGVVNIITKKPMGTSTHLFTEAGSFNNRRIGINTNGKISNIGYRLAFQKAKSGDYTDGSGRNNISHSDANNLAFSLSQKLSDKNELIGHYSSYHADYKYTAFWEPTIKNGNVSKNLYSLTLKSSPTDTSSNTLIYSQGNYKSVFNKYPTQLKDVFVSDQYNNQLNAENNLTLGFDYQYTKVITANNKAINTKGIYIQDQITPNDKLKVTVGNRYISNNYYGHKNNPSLNIGYNFDKNNNAYVSYNKYFITPQLSQLVGRYGNPDLKPEVGNTKEIGFNHRFDKNTVASAHYFKRYSENRIGYSYVTSKYANVGNEKAHGWDMQLKKKLDKNIDTFLGYTHTHIDATAQRATNVDGYIPKDSVNVGLNYHKDAWDASLTGYGALHRLGPQTPDVKGSFFPSTSYWVWNMAVNYKANENLTAYVKVNNIFNRFYANASNARVNWGGAAGQWWGMPGRSLLFGIDYKF